MSKQRKTITKAEIIKALKTEKLDYGQWVSDRYDKACAVCAVGAVLRAAKFDNYGIEVYANELLYNGPLQPSSVRGFVVDDSDSSEEFGYTTVNKMIKKLIDKKNYLNALSLKFEHHAESTGTGVRTRRILVEFVKKNFPNRIKL